MIHTNLVRWFLSLLLLPLLCGCLEYEEIEVRVVADLARDQIDLCIVSRGIHTRDRRSEGDKEPYKAELQQLLSLRDRVALPIGGFFPLDLTDLARDERRPGSAKPSDRLYGKLFEFIELEAGRFHRDADGKLCLYQFVRINRAKAFVAWVNETLRDTELWEDREIDEASRKLMDDFIERKTDFLAVDGTGMRFRMPCSEEAHQKMIEEVRREFLSRADEDRRSEGEVLPRFLRLLLDNRLAMVRHERHTDFYLGTQGATSGSWWLVGQLGYHPGLLVILEQKEGPVAAMTGEELVAAFAAFRERDAQEPEAVLAARKALGLSGGK